MKRSIVVAVTATLTAFALAFPVSTAATACPTSVTSAVLQAHPGATIGSCTRVEEKGQTQFEVKIAAKDGKRVELDVTPEGKILVTEEAVAVSEVPPAVTKAFAAKYGSAKPTRAVSETAADGTVTYELAFVVGGKKKEATFASDGNFLEEE